jgi:hypothetical protein
VGLCCTGSLPNQFIFPLICVLCGGNCRWGVELGLCVKPFAYCILFTSRKFYRYGNACIDIEQVVLLPSDWHHTKSSLYASPEYINERPANYTITYTVHYFPFHQNIDLSLSFIFYSGCFTFLFFPPTPSSPVSVTSLSYSVILSPTTTKALLQRPKLTTLFYLCAISAALSRITQNKN